MCGWTVKIQYAGRIISPSRPRDDLKSVVWLWMRLRGLSMMDGVEGGCWIRVENR